MGRSNRYLRDILSQLTLEEVQEAIDLTPTQQKAVDSFKKAVTKCEKAGVEFYTVLETISFLNGKNIETIGDAGDFDYMEDPIDSLDLNTGLSHESSFNMGFSGWADDTHYVFLKESTARKIIRSRKVKEV